MEILAEAGDGREGVDALARVRRSRVVVLVGLGANMLAGWWWMDPVAGLVIGAVAVREDLEVWQRRSVRVLSRHLAGVASG